MTRAIVLDRRDNVATLIDPGPAGEACALQGEGEGTASLSLLQDIPFGHKVCVRDTAKGADVVKYGQVIGKASAQLRVGEHVHIHNVDSARGRGDQARG